MTEETTTAPAPLDTVAKFTLPGLEGERSFDCALIPAPVRLDFLQNAVRSYIFNRVNATQMRHNKDEKVQAWAAYDKAAAADPLQTVVPKPEGERPAAADLEGAYLRAVEALTTGDIRKQGGEPKAKKAPADPLVALVSKIVTDEVFASIKATNPKYSYLEAKKLVGNGIEYLNAKIEEKVAAGVDRGLLEKMRDTKYIAPARLMVGQTSTKAMNDLPSVL